MSLRISCLTALLALAPAACQRSPQGADAAPGNAAAGKAAAAKGDPGKGGKGPGADKGGPIPVKVAKVEKKLAPRVVYSVSALAGRHQADIYSKVIGRITYLGPKEGMPVREGDVLFRVDRSDPGESYLNAPTPSPLTGWIGRWHVVNVGEQVTPNDPVVTVVDDAELRAIAYLPSGDWVEVRPDTKVTATLEGLERPAKVLFIARAADVTSGRGSITVEVTNPQHDWRAGMFARFRFELSPKERMLVSAASLIITDQGAFVYIADGDKAKRVPVQFRVVDSDTIEILSGLAPESRVVVAGANLLGDQSPIHVID